MKSRFKVIIGILVLSLIAIGILVALNSKTIAVNNTIKNVTIQSLYQKMKIETDQLRQF